MKNIVSIPVLKSTEIRTELFKLFYESGEFDINQPQDVPQTLECLLGVIHGWLATTTDHKKDVSKLSLNDCISSECGKECLAHLGFHQMRFEQDECLCGEKGEVVSFSNNLFASKINAIEVLSESFAKSNSKDEVKILFESHQKLIN